MSSRTPPDPLRHQMRLLRSMGFVAAEGPLPGAEAAPSAAPAQHPADAPPASPVTPPLDAAPASTMELGERVTRLEAIAARVSACTGCRLCHARHRTVPGEGDPLAPLMFVGEAPGAEEDQQGRPFVGAAGQLLTKIIEAMKFRREEVFIANICKCRPPGNRQPEEDEMAACLPYLEEQIAIVAPRVIVALGKTAMMGLMPAHRASTMGSLRGKWMEYRGVPLMPTFHPAYLLRSPGQKRLVWEDMQEVMRVFGKTP